MNRYKLIISYDGTEYHGWQAQDGLPTIAGSLSSSFNKAFQFPVKLLATSRTDAGVHAHGQIVSADTQLDLDPAIMMRVWNHALPPTIAIHSIERVDLNFNLFAPQEKIYWYHVSFERPLPFFSRYVWYYSKKISMQKWYEALQVFVGTHDFRSFSTGDERGDDTIRTIHAIDVVYVPELQAYRVIVKGPKFLHHMIRRIVGASLDIASRKQLSVHFLQQVLAQKNPSQQLTNAPAQGLVLYQVTYL